jgi:hypothetical protein
MLLLLLLLMLWDICSCGCCCCCHVRFRDHLGEAECGLQSKELTDQLLVVNCNLRQLQLNALHLQRSRSNGAAVEQWQISGAKSFDAGAAPISSGCSATSLIR